MAAVFRTLVSSQDPVKPIKKPSPSRNATDIERDEHTTSQTPSPTASASKRFNIFRRRKHNRKKMQTQPTPEPEQEPESTGGLEVTRDPAADAPMYFNHPLEAVQPREAFKRGNRDSYANELQNLVRGTAAPQDDDHDDDIQEIRRAGDDVTSPKSYFDDYSSDEEGPAPAKGKGLKKSFTDLKVSTSQFLAARSQTYGGRLGSGGMAGGSGIGLGIGEIEQTKKSPVISSPTDFRRLNSAQEWPDFSERGKSRSPSLAKSPSTPSMGSQKGRLGKMPSTSNLWDGFWGKAQEASPTKQPPSEAEESGAAELRGKTPAYLARAQRRHQAALPMIAERPAAPSPPPRDAGERSSSPVSSSSSFYVEDAEPSALPPPLNVVKRREIEQPPPQPPQQTLPARRGADGKIERSPSFLRRIQELGDERRRLMTSVSHPALRINDSAGETIVRSTTGAVSTENLQQQLILDDAPPVPPLPATAPLPQRPFAPRRASFERAVQNFWSPSDPYLTPEKALRDRLVGNAFMQQLRRDDFGLEPLRKAEKGAANKHPKHPLKWDTENLMCIGKHNAAEIAGTMDDGTIEKEKPTNMSAVSLPKPKLKAKASTRSFTSAKNLDSHLIDEAKKCALCGRFCCHFIELLNYLHSPATARSPTPNPGFADVADERNRIHASAKVMRLKQEHPNGLDPYDTFVTCGDCGKEVCARCAKKCEEELCGAVYCQECGECGHEG